MGLHAGIAIARGKKQTENRSIYIHIGTSLLYLHPRSDTSVPKSKNAKVEPIRQIF